MLMSDRLADGQTDGQLQSIGRNYFAIPINGVMVQIQYKVNIPNMTLTFNSKN